MASRPIGIAFGVIANVGILEWPLKVFADSTFSTPAMLK